MSKLIEEARLTDRDYMEGLGFIPLPISDVRRASELAIKKFLRLLTKSDEELPLIPNEQIEGYFHETPNTLEVGRCIAATQRAADQLILSARIHEAERKERERTQQETIDAVNAYVAGKVSFEKCAELIGINFYELAEFCFKKGQALTTEE